jgi:hypothetical protein
LKLSSRSGTLAEMGQEMRLDDLSPEAYEAEVGYGLLDVCEEDHDKAIAVFKHPNNKGGWMYGDAVAFIERKKG